MSPITAALKSAKIRIEETVKIDEKSLYKAPCSGPHNIENTSTTFITVEL
jgi:hypothetical protein